jgi:peptidoglycan/LPS O-acetylase OafA/YrhL
VFWQFISIYGENKMTKTNRVLLAGAAIAGLLSGTAATIQASNLTKASAQDDSKWGRISYCIYLIHAAVKYFCTNRMAHNATQITLWRSEAAVMLSVVITFGIAKLSWTFFESLLLRQGHRYKY